MPTFPPSPALSSTGRVALVCADRGAEPVRRAAGAALAELQQALPTSAAVDTFEVASLTEAPLLAKKLARSGRYRAIIACGLQPAQGPGTAGDGGPTVEDALRRVSCDTAVPVFPALLVVPCQPAAGMPQGLIPARMAQQGQLAAQDCVRSLMGAAAGTATVALPGPEMGAGDPAAVQAMG